MKELTNDNKIKTDMIKKLATSVAHRHRESPTTAVKFSEAMKKLKN